MGDFIQDKLGGMSIDKVIDNLLDLGVHVDDVSDILENMGFKTKEVAEATKKLSGAAGVGMTATSKLGTAFSGLAAKIGISTAALGTLVGVLAAVGVGFAIFKAYKADLQESIDNAKTAADAWESSNASLDSQIERLKELDALLKEGNLTEEEAYNVKSELYSIQQSLGESYGDLASGIDLVNGKLSDEIDKVNELSAAWANEFINENRKGGEEAVRQMEKQRSLFIGQFNPDAVSDDVEVLKDIFDKYSEFVGYSDGGDGLLNVYIKGDATEAHDALNSIMTEIRTASNELDSTPILDHFYRNASGRLEDVNEIIENVGDLYEQYKDALLVGDISEYTFGDEKKVAIEWIKEYTDAIEEYNSALVSGDPEKIDIAAKNFEEAKNTMDALVSGDMSKYADEIADVEDALNTAAIAAYEFKSAVSGDNSVFGKDVRHYAYQLKNLGLDDIDLKDMLKTDEVDEVGERQFRALMDAAYECGLISGKTVDDIQPLIDILIELGYVAGETASQTQDANEKMVSSYDDAVKSVSDLKSELGAINGAISEQGYSGNLSPETYGSLIAISKDYAACVEYQNGALQLNAEKANILFEANSKLKKAEIELQKVTEAAKWKENADEIARLTKEYDGLDPVIKDQIDNLKKKNESIEANLVGYDLQIAAIEELTSAYGRWKAVSESDNSDSMYKDIQKAYEQIKEAQKTGQTGVGNVVYQAAVELLVPDGQDVDKYMSTLKKYIMDGSSGLTNFINDMVTNNLMDRTGSEVKMKMGVTMEQICETMKITPDMAKAIFNALEMYDFDFDWTEEDYNFNIDTSKIDAEIAELEARIAEITSDTTVELKPGESLESLKKSLDEAYAKKQAMLSGDSTTSGENDITYTVNANTEAADNALESIKSKLDEIAAKIDEISKKVIGNLGADKTNGVLSGVYQLLLKINNFKIADKSFNVYENVVSSSSSGTKKSGGSSGSIKAHAEADGTRKAKAGLALVGDEYSSDGSPKPELIISDGVAYVAGQNGPEFVNLKNGDQVVPAKETKKILHGNPGARRSLVQAFATGAGGYAAGSAAEQMYLDGKIPATAEWLKQQEKKKKASTSTPKKDLFDKLVAEGASPEKMSSAMAAVSKNSGASISGGGNTSSLRNPGGSGGGGSGSSGSSSSSGSSTKEKSQFEKDYEAHNHLVAMEKESYEDYLKWLEGAYEDAYNKGEIELEDYRKYMEEVFEGQKELFQDSIEDIEHKIKFLEREPGNEREIITYYNRIITKIDAEIAAARARGLNDDDDYIQELLEQKWDYADEIADIEEEITENAKDAVDELVDYRVDMLKQEIEDHKDALNDKLDALKDFYDEQKQMLQDSYDEEKYLEEQNEKRRSVSDIKDELDQLRFDNSAAAEKRKLELQEELKAAEKDLSDFEKDKALQDAMDLLDKQYEQQEKDIQSQIDELDAKLNDPNALFNQALSDIKHNTAELYGEMVAYNNAHGDGNPETIKEMYDSAKESLDQFLKTFGEAYKDILLVGSSSSAVTGYASGTSHATKGVHELFEGGKDEYVYQTKDGHRYKMFSGLGDKVLNASATDFLYKFANNGEAFMTNMIKSLFGSLSPTSLIRSPGTVSVSTGDIVIQGNADSATVSEIRRAQRENVNHILREFVKLNR